MLKLYVAAKNRLGAIKDFFVKKKEEGATMAEYAIMLAFIAVVCIAVVAALGSTIWAVFNTANNALESASTVAPKDPV